MGRLIDADKLIDKAYDVSPAYGMTVIGVTEEDIEYAPTVEAIPKAEYETRLKADIVDSLTELKKEIEKQCKIPNNCASAYDWNNGIYACYKVIQQKIDKLKEN